MSFLYREELDWTQFFWFDKSLVLSQWRAIHPSGRAVYPVIAAHCKDGIAFPGERRIAILSGRSDKQARKGIGALEDLGIVQIQPYTTSRGKRSKRFLLNLPSGSESGSAFPFFGCVLHGGNWSFLKPSAQAVYVSMRYWGYFDLDTYDELEEEPAEPSEFDEIFRERKCDYCEADPQSIADVAGVTIRSLPEALANLQSQYLIEKAGSVYRVFLRPKAHWKASYLNRKIMESYRHEYQDSSEKTTGHKRSSEKSTGNGRKKVPGNRKKV